jgi:hypothetical protein
MSGNQAKLSLFLIGRLEIILFWVSWFSGRPPALHRTGLGALISYSEI